MNTYVRNKNVDVKDSKDNKDMSMVKSFKHFRVQFGTNSKRTSETSNSTPVYRYSVYMQSKDSSWLNRNINNQRDESPEPLEEDIRD